MCSRFLVSIASITLPLCLVSCFSFSRTSNYDSGFKDRFEKAAKEIVLRSLRAEEAALKGQRVSVDPKVMKFVQRHFAKADELVLAHALGVRKALSHGGFFELNDYVERRSTLLDFSLKLQPSLDIIESKFANATAFPSGKILLNRPLAEAFDVNRDDFDDVLLGVLIHELIHVRDGHALEQWATSDGRHSWAKDKFIAAASSLTALIPFLTIKYDMQYPITFGSTAQLPALSEYAADLGAVSLLDKAGYNSGRYIAFLSEMSANIVRASSETGPSLLRQRVECLGNFSKSRFEEELQVIVIGSIDAGDQVIQSLDLRISYKIASILDSPEALAKEYPVKAEVSDADRRCLLLTEIRKNIYTGHAIRNAFPKALMKQGTLRTPTFDLMLFTQYF